MRSGVEFTVQVEMGEYLIGSWVLLLRKRWLAPLLATALLAAVVATTWRFNDEWPAYFQSSLLALVVVMLLVVVCVGHATFLLLLSLVHWFQSPSNREPTTYQLLPDRVVLASPTVRNEFAWSHVKRVTESATFFYLHVDRVVFFVPKRCVPEAAWTAVREIFRANLAGKAKLQAG